MIHLRLSGFLAVALLATIWGSADARVPTSMRRVRGQFGRVAPAELGAPDVLRPEASASFDTDHRLESRPPAAMVAVVPVLLARHLADRRQLHATSCDITPRTSLPHSSRAPPQHA